MINKKLHILFLCGWYPSRVFRNNGDFIERHAAAVSKQHQVTVFHIISDKNNTKNIEIEYENKNNVDIYIAYVKSTKNPFFKVFLYIQAFLKLLKKTTTFDLVHLNEIYPLGLFCIYLKKVKGIPFIISEHWTGYLKENRKSITNWQKKAVKFILRNTNMFCPVSTHLKDQITQWIGYSPSFTVIPNVVDTNIFKPKTHNTELFTLLHISNMKDDHKNVSGILKTLATFKKNGGVFKFILMGDRSVQYKTISTTLDIAEHIEFVDHLSHSEVASYMQKANLFLLFSNYENLPCVILESFSCGTPVISTNVGGVHEYFPEHFGKIIPKGDQNALLDVLHSYYAKHQGIASKESMYAYAEEHFSYPAIAEQFSRVYSRVLNNATL